MILTIDLGSSATKAALWDDPGLVSMSHVPLMTSHPHPGWCEQAPDAWWGSVVSACRQLDPRDRGTVEAIGFSAARETFVPVSAAGECLGPGIMWSDRRAATQASRITTQLGGAEAVRQRTGVVLGAGSTVAKVGWLADNDPDLLAASRWLLSPRDVVVMRITGEVQTDWTLASRTGFYDIGGDPVPELASVAGDRLPPVREPACVVGGVDREAGRQLGLAPDTPVVLGAGDRACEVLGSGASPSEPVVSWGTTANISMPVGEVSSGIPGGLSVSRGAFGAHIFEAGLSASGQGLSWLAGLSGKDPETLVEEAARAEPGSGGVIALPWLNGARAPWWSHDASAAFLGITPATGPAHLARALFEGVATDVARCLESTAPLLGRQSALRAVGRGGDAALWLDVLAGVTGLPVLTLRSREAASAGACIITASATGARPDAAAINPVTSRHDPDLASVHSYRRMRPRSDAAARAVLHLDRATGSS